MTGTAQVSLLGQSKRKGVHDAYEIIRNLYDQSSLGLPSDDLKSERMSARPSENRNRI